MNITWAIINSFITAAVALIVTMWRENVREKQQQVAYLHSILAEVNSLIALISVRKDEFGLQDINDVENYEFVYFPTTFSYFNVYESTASDIGMVRNISLRKRIICSYADVKGLFENIRDIENISKMYESLMLTNKDSVDKARMVEIHYLYCERTLKEQVPMVQSVLETLKKELETEVEKRSKLLNLYVYDRIK